MKPSFADRLDRIGRRHPGWMMFATAAIGALAMAALLLTQAAGQNAVILYEAF